MPRPRILIKDLVKGNQLWKMHVHVVDIWVVMEKSGQQHLKLVIQNGKDWIEQLKEHETYAIYNGEPMANDGPLKVCSHSLKLVFNGGTTISNIIIPKIPPHQFKYKAIGDFLNGHFQNDMLYDVIGILQDVVKTQLGDGGTKSYANIMLHDDVGNVIEVTPSAKHTNSAQPSISANQTRSPSTSSINIPAKRVVISTSLDELFLNYDLTPKQSTTKVNHLKKE
ncbi:hypothetical protein KIW84_041455 [Lathyrus oleraceus]|uniref:DUF223 domain-containing protein n=1 Tax=Pisum sativum TaxID=3888 RepID=A0A9D4X9P9_PEA|nr:hypothetical protein KIW84_041455 [Pisum sativum]